MIKTFMTVLKYEKDDEATKEHDDKVNSFLFSREGEIDISNVDNQVLNTGTSYGNRLVTFIEYELKANHTLTPSL